MFNWNADKCKIDGTDISFMYEVEKYQGQGMIIFCIYVMKGDSTTVFNFSYSSDDDSLGISIYENYDDTVHSSEVKNLDEFEARLFQIGTLVDTYDLSSKMYDTMRDLHRLYFREKYETIQSNVV